MMNNSIIKKLLYSGVIMLAVLTSSCEKWLEVEPDQGLIISEYWKSKEDVKATLMAAYRNFALLNDNLFLYGELRADMIQEGPDALAREKNIMDSNITPDNFLCRWDNFYTVIHHCNLILEHSDEVQRKDPNFTAVTLKAYKAEAIYLRSLAYFYLIKVFKDVPFVLNSSETDNISFFIPKTDGEVIIDSLINMLEIAVSYMPKNQDYGSDAENKGRAGYGSINALLADIYLWKFDYEKSLEILSRVEDLGKYLLLPSGNWYDIYYPGNSLEGIFELQFDDANDLKNDTYSLTYSENRFDLSDYALEILNPSISNEIIRGNGSICINYTFHNNKEAEFIWKYCGTNPDGKSVRSSADRNSANYIIYRYADIMLMKAEALSQTGKFTEALGLINEIRVRANMPTLTNVILAANAFEDLILSERAKEFAFEGKRWFDLLRMGRRNDYARKDDLIEILIKDAPATQKRILATKLEDPYGWYLPIHETELERNSKLVQNPYYQQYNATK
ncbi:MAG: RagB/SusD family nutrient uptake outer membrane protein [Bacteroidales bacterium]|nr:RagB/SusD family nutrient uptake outer membrane protein [Bacteroidales bacterium]